MDIYCRVMPHGLVPLHESDHDLMSRLRTGATVRCRVTLPRNYRFHKKFFALVRLTLDNLPLPLCQRWGIRSEGDMLRRFKRDLGLFTSWTNERGEREIEYRSISFAAMDEQEFERFYDDCVSLVLRTYIPGVLRADLEEEVGRFL